MTVSQDHTFQVNTLSGLELHNVKAKLVTYRGCQSIRMIERGEPMSAIAILPGLDFRDAVIETEVAGSPRSNAPQDMRGFVGIAFRVQPHGSHYECFFLRPTNGRADDQVRRNHSTQYISFPDYPWYRLREEAPGMYESYTDLVPGAWTPIRIVVSGMRAQLYVNGAEQPCLIVNDLKLGETQGQIAFWIGSGTEAHFSSVTVKRVQAVHG